jgi:hypothetical protein
MTFLSRFFRPKIELFVRHCHFSDISVHKSRFPGFSRKKCHDNLMKTLDRKQVNVTFLLDTFHPTEKPHFITEQDEFPVVTISEGTEAGSFLQLLDLVTAKKLRPDTIVYFLEDDYLHREGWAEILLEGFSLPHVDYVTLFDDRDKYFRPMYADLQAKLSHTESCHWRTTPSTTNTYATRFETLQKSIATHREFSLNRKISADYDKFCALRAQGATLISPIPGWSTHVEVEYASPCLTWTF